MSWTTSGISRNPNANLLKKVAFALARRPSASMIRQRLANAMQVRNPKAALCEAFELDPKRLRARFHNIEHHRAHMASAFFVSPFPEAAILSVDGMGDFVQHDVGRRPRHHARESPARSTSRTPSGSSTPRRLSGSGSRNTGTRARSWASRPTGVRRTSRRSARSSACSADGTFELDLDYFVHHAAGASMTFDEGSPEIGTMYSDKFVDTFGEARVPDAPLTEQHQDVAASLQAMLEEAEFALVRRLQRETGQSALCMAGGVALNSAFNGKILPEHAVHGHLHPAGRQRRRDRARRVLLHLSPRARPPAALRDDRGLHRAAVPRPTRSRRRSTAAGLAYRRLDGAALARRAAQIVAGGDVLGWFQGRMEWGPRALGNRSIIADPRRADMKDILNARIKHREPFRPFAPSVLLEAVGDYFDQTYPDPFMVKVYNVLPEQRAQIPAVTHVDGTGRLQTVDRDANPRYWALIAAFRDLTGVPVVLNTSFNENEPIVCTPDEAIECFLRTRMDALADRRLSRAEVARPPRSRPRGARPQPRPDRPVSRTPGPGVGRRGPVRRPGLCAGALGPGPLGWEPVAAF